jgi:hypothetical protein
MNPAKNKNTALLRAQVLNGWRLGRKPKQIFLLVNEVNDLNDQIKYPVSLFSYYRINLLKF